LIVLHGDDLHKWMVHEHAFVLEAADVIWSSHEDAVAYLKVLARGSF